MLSTFHRRHSQRSSHYIKIFSAMTILILLSCLINMQQILFSNSGHDVDKLLSMQRDKDIPLIILIQTLGP